MGKVPLERTWDEIQSLSPPEVKEPQARLGEMNKQARQTVPDRRDRGLGG